MILCLGACAPEHSSYSEFRTFDNEGWFAAMPVKFSPQMPDSVIRNVNVELAVRHNSSYAYRNLVLVVDMIDKDHRCVRKNVSIDLADEYGSWKGNGFGRLYQVKVDVAQNVSSSSVHSIVVWQAMKGCDKIENIENLGVIVSPADN